MRKNEKKIYKDKMRNGNNFSTKLFKSLNEYANLETILAIARYTFFDKNIC